MTMEAYNLSQKIANTFNKFFCDILKQIENRIVEIHKNVQDYLLNYRKHI